MSLLRLRQHVAGVQAANTFGIGINDNTTASIAMIASPLLFEHVRAGIRVTTSFRAGLIEPTEGPLCLDTLFGTDPCRCVLFGADLDPRILLAPHLWSGSP
jgi:hypothetical protein